MRIKIPETDSLDVGPEIYQPKKSRTVDEMMDNFK